MDNDALFDIFKTAIYSEHEAYEFYRKVAAEATNLEAKSLFEKLAAIEKGHQAALEELYKTLKK
jgi:rubrerythrin